MLADRLAERLEILLIMRIALGRLALFNSQQIAKLFGEPIAVATREIVSQRQQTIENALGMLRRQYPDYLTELEVRFQRNRRFTTNEPLSKPFRGRPHLP